MKTKSIDKRSDQDQARLFIEKARELGADKSDAGADALMTALHMPPEQHEPAKKKRTKPA